MATMELKVPDIGDFKDVEVIELLVKVGDEVMLDQSLVTVESDKASMEIPSTGAGRVVSLSVKLGDKVSEGSVLGVVEAAGASSAASTGGTGPSTEQTTVSAAAATTVSAGSKAEGVASVGAERVGSSREGRAAPPEASAPAIPSRAADLETQMLVLGAGPGGYSAAFRAADLGLQTVLVERYSTLGGVCLNVGCIPSKALLHVAAVMDEAKHFADLGVTFGEPKVDLERLRTHKEKVIGKLTSGLAGMAKARKVQVVQGVGRFLDPRHIEVVAADGKKTVIRFAQAIVAAGSEAVKLPFLPDDPRVVTSTGALELRQWPKRMLVIGGGIIGLE
ncbi:MAG: dihydrolipoamide dehydrogenase, partial [Pseudomonadota bacterium]